MSTTESVADVLREVRACTVCAAHLPHPPRPVLQLHPSARILIASQAPGRRVHESGIPFDDPSGDRLREWMAVSRDVFYDPTRIAVLPMGFCYPGGGSSGDRPPRPECAPLWRPRLLRHLPNVELTLLVGAYAQRYVFGSGRSLTDVVADWRRTWPSVVPLPHPSPRNNPWLARNPWFLRELAPALAERCAAMLNGT